MERYIEVTGEGKFIETAVLYIAEVTLEVRTSKDETALKELAELCVEAVAILREAGLLDEEIVEGGTDFYRPWYWKKQVGQSAVRKVILKVTDFGRLNHALERLEPLQSRNKERRSISIDMRQPEFEESSDSKPAVLVQAFENAKAKALQLAAGMNCRLGQPIYVEEGGWSKRNSGFSGDEDWEGDYSRFAMGGAMMLAEASTDDKAGMELQPPTRTIFVKCRVRFAIENP